jgi:hypothetical protein
MKKMYLKLIGLLSLSFSMEQDPNIKIQDYHLSSDEDSELDEEGYIVVTPKHEEHEEHTIQNTKYISEEVKSLLNFFQLMEISLNLDFGNYQEYKSTLQLYNNYISSFFPGEDFIPLLKEESYEKFMLFFKKFNEHEKQTISLKNRENFLLIDMNSSLMKSVINGGNQIMPLFGKVNIQDIYNDIFLGHNIFDFLKMHLIGDDTEINKNNITKYIQYIEEIISFLIEENVYKDKKSFKGSNLHKVLKYFLEGLNHLSIKDDFTLGNLMENKKEFFAFSHTKEDEIMYILKILIKKNFKFNQDQFICPGLTELLIFKKDVKNNQMNFEEVNNFINIYWNGIMGSFYEIILSIQESKNNIYAYNAELLHKLSTDKNFIKNFIKNIEKCILQNNKEIILDSKEILLSVSLNKDKYNIFFINSAFMTNLLNVNMLLNNKKNYILNEKIEELKCLIGCEKETNIKNSFVKSCLMGVLFSDGIKNHLNGLIKQNNEHFIKYLTSLNTEVKKIGASNEQKNLLKSIKLLLDLNKKMSENENVEHIVGLCGHYHINNENNEISLKYLDYNGKVKKEITMLNNQIHDCKELKPIGEFANGIFEIEKTSNQV